MNDNIDKDKSGHRVLLYLLLFFGVCLSVNGFFVYKAVTTHTGVIAENTYKIGLNYNELITEAKKRKNAQGTNSGE